MTNRERNVRLRFDLTDKELFGRKKEESEAKSMSHLYTKNSFGKENL